GIIPQADLAGNKDLFGDDRADFIKVHPDMDGFVNAAALDISGFQPVVDDETNAAGKKGRCCEEERKGFDGCVGWGRTFGLWRMLGGVCSFVKGWG
ncbi:MAG: hypothetical protein WBP18_13400, partial [Paracoccaceae bacterium]